MMLLLRGRCARMLATGLLGLAGYGGAACATGTPLAPPAVYPAGTWQGKGTAVVRVLDRLDAHVEVLSVPVGGEAIHYKNLDILARRCLQRPPTRAPDAAAWLEIQDTHPGGATFKGWMLAAEPGLGVLESSVYDVRMVKCAGDDMAPFLPALPKPVAPPPLPEAAPVDQGAGMGQGSQILPAQPTPPGLVAPPAAPRPAAPDNANPFQPDSDGAY
ncbi:DUF2155 domain-containing protein [Acetobacter fabarum]|uniref:DUF2155 domain-containing protein n=1 Tax=Acetobacter fabarum TaxID=483199 RepID=UPI0020A13831|nr:DUF2155 domain-containing protein [Acetobacter fabarum]MCP1227850.1 DUF2155 domain-containing protein [Acetobacter fabarum]MCP1233345.1 DUF2155 domain-containing protein [Acetobacter fabarum]